MIERAFRVSLVTPTYNESDTIVPLADEIFAVVGECPDINLELIVVDDNSPDGTARIARTLSTRYPVTVLERAGKGGLGSAVMAGFAHSRRPYLGVIDADMSHDPGVLPLLIRGLAESDVVIASRFGATSRVETWPLHRRLISLLGVSAARMLTGVEDPLSGYFFLRRSVIEGLELTSPGYKLLLEILVKGHFEKTRSIPFTFRTRDFGHSKLDVREYGLFLKQLLVFSSRKLQRRARGHRGDDVGGTGA